MRAVSPADLVTSRRWVAHAAFWTCLLGGVLCLGVFLHGLVRDRSDPRLAIDLSSRSHAEGSIRLWGPGRYTLYLTTVSHGAADVGARFAGDLEVELIGPRGEAIF